MACTNSVLRIGPSDDNVTTKLLRNAVVSHFDKLQDSQSKSEDSAQTTSLTDSSSKTLTISNKYFTANVVLEDLEDSMEEKEKSKEDGIILVFDALRSNPDLSVGTESTPISSFDSLSLAHEKAEGKDTCGDLLRLCVGVSLSSLSPTELRGKDHEKEYSRRILWCLDHQYEYIEADLSQEGQAKGHTDRDKDGFARIVEAIQGTVWSSAVMSKKKTNELKESYRDDSKAMKKEQTTTTEEEEENPYIPPDPSKFGDISNFTKDGTATTTTNDDIAEKLLGTEEESKNTTSGVLLPSQSGDDDVSSDDIKKLRKDMETEQIFDNMEGLLREAARVRDAAKAGTMTDDERRQRAGDAAMALMNIMDQFAIEEDEKSDGGYDDSSDDSGIVDD